MQNELQEYACIPVFSLSYPKAYYSLQPKKTKRKSDKKATICENALRVFEE